MSIGTDDIKNNLEKIVWHLDEPNFNPTAAAIFLLSKVAKEKVAVVLGGDGGDELFGGYPRYYYSYITSIFQKMPAALQYLVKCGLGAASKGGLIEKLNLSPGAERVVAFLAQKNGLLKRVLNEGVYKPDLALQHINERYFNGMRPTDDFEKQFMNLDRQSWLVDESLLRTDKMTMAYGLEERVPILDYRLVELSTKIPTSWKINILKNKPGDFQGKAIWREAIRPYLPPHVLNQKKRGWFTPMAKWLRGGLRKPVEEILFSIDQRDLFLNSIGLKQIWDRHLDGSEYNLNIIWAVVMWRLWYKKFIK